MKNLLCKIGFHKLDYLSFNVVNVFGDAFFKCKRCGKEELFDGKLASDFIIGGCVDTALKDILLTQNQNYD